MQKGGAPVHTAECPILWQDWSQSVHPQAQHRNKFSLTWLMTWEMHHHYLLTWPVSLERTSMTSGWRFPIPLSPWLQILQGHCTMMATTIIPFLWEEPDPRLALHPQPSLQVSLELSPGIEEYQTQWSMLMIGSRHRSSGTPDTLAGGESLEHPIENLHVYSAMPWLYNLLNSRLQPSSCPQPKRKCQVGGKPCTAFAFGSSGLPTPWWFPQYKRFLGYQTGGNLGTELSSAMLCREDRDASQSPVWCGTRPSEVHDAPDRSWRRQNSGDLTAQTHGRWTWNDPNRGEEAVLMVDELEPKEAQEAAALPNNQLSYLTLHACLPPLSHSIRFK